MRMLAAIFVILLLVGCGSQPAAPAASKAQVDPPADPAQPAAVEVSHAKDVQSIVAASCLPCHSGGKNATARTNWTTYEGIMSDVVAGQPDSSRFYRMLRDGKMPPGGRLSPAQVDLVRNWIAQGARNN